MAKFKKGNAGRRPGSRNRVTKAVKEAVMEALNADEGAVAFFVRLKNSRRAEDRRCFAQVCSRLLPIEAHLTTPPPIDTTDMQDVARRLAVLFRRVREAEAVQLPQLAEKVVTSD